LFPDEIAKLEKKWQIERRNKIIQRIIHETSTFRSTETSRQERKSENEVDNKNL
jgi:uncharacterized protein YcbK (DUF882 family)